MKKVAGFLALILITTVTLTGCANSNSEPEVSSTPEITTPVQQAPENPVQETEVPIEPTEELPAFLFEDVSDLEFYFSSGAGGWRTILHISADGSFEGVFSDSEMGDMGDDYPGGTYYYCQFSGAFTSPEKVNDYTYSVKLDSLEYSNTDSVEIIDGVRYIYSTPYGIEGAEELHLYLPGTPVTMLPEAYLEWVLRTELSEKESTLPFYGLYNVTEKCGFSSYEMLTASEIIAANIESAEAADAEISKLLDDPYLTQADMNTYSYELYVVWDTALNNIWNILKDNLDEETMSALTEEEIAWIHKKEAAMDEAGKDVEGGSLYPTVVNSVGAEYTKERVYELAKYLQ